MTARRGYTLVELLITIAITGFLASLMFTNFSKERDRNGLKSTVATLQSFIQDMQTKAQSGVVLGLPTEPSGFGVDVDVAAGVPNTFNTYGDIDGNKKYSGSGSDAFLKRIAPTASSGISISKVTSTDIPSGTPILRVDILFLKPNGTAILTATLTGNSADDQVIDDTTIYLKSSRLNNVCYAITVTAGVGTVSQKQFQSSC